MTANEIAFLAMISHSEGTDRAFDPYRVCYGYKHTSVDQTYHPAEIRADGTCEWHGEPLDSLGPRYAGKVSTAAGRYQIRLSTWQGCKTTLKLADFTAPSQDAACLLLIRERGALGLVNDGDIRTAIAQCQNEWASLPGGNSGQPQQRLADLVKFYNDKIYKIATAPVKV